MNPSHKFVVEFPEKTELGKSASDFIRLKTFVTELARNLENGSARHTPRFIVLATNFEQFWKSDLREQYRERPLVLILQQPINIVELITIAQSNLPILVTLGPANRISLRSLTRVIFCEVYSAEGFWIMPFRESTPVIEQTCPRSILLQDILGSQRTTHLFDAYFNGTPKGISLSDNDESFLLSLEELLMLFTGFHANSRLGIFELLLRSRTAGCMELVLQSPFRECFPRMDTNNLLKAFTSVQNISDDGLLERIATHVFRFTAPALSKIILRNESGEITPRDSITLVFSAKSGILSKWLENEDDCHTVEKKCSAFLSLKSRVSISQFGKICVSGLSRSPKSSGRQPALTLFQGILSHELTLLHLKAEEFISLLEFTLDGGHLDFAEILLNSAALREILKPDQIAGFLIKRIWLALRLDLSGVANILFPYFEIEDIADSNQDILHCCFVLSATNDHQSAGRLVHLSKKRNFKFQSDVAWRCGSIVRDFVTLESRANEILNNPPITSNSLYSYVQYMIFKGRNNACLSTISELVKNVSNPSVLNMFRYYNFLLHRNVSSVTHVSKQVRDLDQREITHAAWAWSISFDLAIFYLFSQKPQSALEVLTYAISLETDYVPESSNPCHFLKAFIRFREYPCEKHFKECINLGFNYLSNSLFKHFESYPVVLMCCLVGAYSHTSKKKRNLSTIRKFISSYTGNTINLDNTSEKINESILRFCHYQWGEKAGDQYFYPLFRQFTQYE